jgi:hypothetical protein
MKHRGASFGLLFGFFFFYSAFCARAADEQLLVGVATADITPGDNYPMSGYYHERLSDGVKDPLLAKAIVFRQGDTSAAWVVCDLIGIAADLTAAVRKGASEKTGIPGEHIILSGTHTHTGPDYMKELFAVAHGRPIPVGSKPREPYVPKLIDAIVTAIAQANDAVQPVTLATGSAVQETPVSFNRRFLMKDGKIRTWMNLAHPDVVHAAGPIDPQIGITVIRNAKDAAPLVVLSSFALHLDTVGGTEFSADYPFYIGRTIQESLGGGVISIFGTGTCGDINHVDPGRTERNKTDFIGTSLGKTICAAIPSLTPVEAPRLRVRRTVVHAPMQDSTPAQLAASRKLLEEIRGGKEAEFFAHVDAYKRVILDGLRHQRNVDESMKELSWGLTKSFSGSGDALPLEVQVITLGKDVAIVALPGEVFVELGLAIKQASPFKTTLVVELSNAVETIYIPTRYAYVGGGYEVVNSILAPGGGELLAEAAIRLLSEAAAEAPTPAK